MSLPSEVIAGLLGGAAEEYDIGRSLRFDSVGLSNLTRTPAGASNRKTWTWSGWVKLALLGDESGLPRYIWSCGTASTAYTAIFLDASDKLNVIRVISSATDAQKITTKTFRDQTNWYHLVVAMDASNARMKIYCNGIEITTFDTNNEPSNIDGTENTAVLHTIGRRSYTATSTYFEGYLADVHFIDGSALTPASFGKFHSVTNSWVPKAYLASPGTNGYFLDFSDNSSAAALGYDAFGSNDWTISALDITDSKIDTPTNNFATLLSIDKHANAALSNGNLQLYNSSISSYSGSRISLAGDITANIYVESITMVGDASGVLGIYPIYNNAGVETGPGEETDEAVIHNNGAGLRTTKTNSIDTNSRSTDVIGDVWKLAFDQSTGKLWLGRNSTWYGGGDPATGATPTYTLTTAVRYAVGVWASYNNLGKFMLNCGQSQNPISPGVTDTFYPGAGGYFRYAPPTGFLALCSKNMVAPAIIDPSAHFDVRTYIGNDVGLQVGNQVVKEYSNYLISKSLRFDRTVSPYLERTPGSAGNEKKWTFSTWAKRGYPSANNIEVLNAYNGGTPGFSVYFESDDKVSVYIDGSEYKTLEEISDSILWHNLIIRANTENSTDATRVRVYIDGVLSTWSTAPVTSVNQDLHINNNVVHRIGQNTSNTFEGYMAETHLVDGLDPGPESFGETDSLSGSWIPKEYSGSYGTNGFYLPYTNNANTTALGYDFAGSNDWTPSNFTVDAGVDNDSLTDTPTNTFATMDPASRANTNTMEDGNLKTIHSANSNVSFKLTMSIPTSTNVYLEATVTESNNRFAFGVCPFDLSLTPSDKQSWGNTLHSYVITNFVGGSVSRATRNNNIYTNSRSEDAANDVFQIAIDPSRNKLWLGRNDTWYGSGSPATGASPTYDMVGTNKPWAVEVGKAGNTTAAIILNTGSRPFAYTQPTGFYTLSTDNLAVMGEVAGSPDLVLIKSRETTNSFYLFDTTRGAKLSLSTDDATVRGDKTDNISLLRFGRDGFYVGSNSTVCGQESYAAYMWNEGVTPGFDIISYSGTSANRAVDHNLGVTPNFIIVRNRTVGDNWIIYHWKNTSAPETDYLKFTNAATADLNTIWNDTAPNTSVFTVGTHGSVNGSGNTYIAYAFAEVEGFSKFGNYVGNGLDAGPVAWCGFRPKCVIIKRTGAANHWLLVDTVCSTVNPLPTELRLNDSAGEVASEFVEILSTGFRVRTTTTEVNASTATYIFMAFAEIPFQYSKAFA